MRDYGSLTADHADRERDCRNLLLAADHLPAFPTLVSAIFGFRGTPLFRAKIRAVEVTHRILRKMKKI